MRLMAFLFSSLFLAGCTNIILDEEEKKSFTGKTQPLEPRLVNTLDLASTEAYKLSAAYFKAGVRAQKSQDAASALIVVSAASVVAGSVSGTSDRALANRGLLAVGAQQAASRGVNKASIESVLDGAQILNCLGVVSAIYSQDEILGSSKAAAGVVIGLVREVRIAVRNGLTRDVANYSTVLSAFKSVLVDSGDSEKAAVEAFGVNVDVASNKKGKKIDPATPEKLEELLTRLSGCVANKKATDNTKPEQ